MTKDQIEARLNELIDEIVEAEYDLHNTEGRGYRIQREDCLKTRKRVMDALIEIYVG